MGTEKRKKDHIRVCLDEDVEFWKGNGFGDYSFTHSALPEMDWDDLDLSAEFLGRKFRAPLFIEAITGGTPEGRRINRNLAVAAQELGIGMGVGSQRAMLENPPLSKTFSVRDVAPDVFLVGNIGASHILRYSPERIGKAMEAIGADAIAVHLNPAQEVAQEGGHRQWKGVLHAIKELKSGISIPVIAKEVGCGISAEVARKLEVVGVDAIDVAGSGGTSWVKVDSLIGGTPFDKFFEWGIPTAESLVQCRKAVRVPLIASGGIRDGIHVAKALSLGAGLAGMALPLLKPAVSSPESVKKALEQVLLELRTAMFLTSSRNIASLKGKAVKC